MLGVLLAYRKTHARINGACTKTFRIGRMEKVFNKCRTSFTQNYRRSIGVGCRSYLKTNM